MTIRLEIKVTPQSGKQQLTRDKSGTIKCFLKSPPVDGKANEELIKLLSKKLSVQQEKIVIIQGATARKKLVKIETELTDNAIFHLLGLEVQTPLL